MNKTETRELERIVDKFSEYNVTRYQARVLASKYTGIAEHEIRKILVEVTA